MVSISDSRHGSSPRRGRPGPRAHSAEAPQLGVGRDLRGVRLGPAGGMALPPWAPRWPITTPLPLHGMLPPLSLPGCSKLRQQGSLAGLPRSCWCRSGASLGLAWVGGHQGFSWVFAWWPGWRPSRRSGHPAQRSTAALAPAVGGGELSPLRPSGLGFRLLTEPSQAPYRRSPVTLARQGG